MDTAQWPEGIGVVKPPMEGNSSGAVNSNNKVIITGGGGGRPQIKPQAVNCPRCNSTHTKFCYYNNYSLSQPRYFCKTCRRYWTEGGSLRNVPVGGGSRKNKRSSSSSSSSLLSKIKSSTNNSQNPNNKIIFHEGQDLNRAYPPPSTDVPEFVEFPSSTTTSSYHHRIPEIFKSGSINGGIRGFSSLMSMINPASDLINTTPVVYSSSSTIATSGQLPNFQEFSKPSGLDFSLDHHGLIGSTLQGVNHHHHHQESSVLSNSHERLFFPFEDLKQQPLLLNSSSTSELMEQQSIRVTHDHQGDHQSTGSYWNINGSGLGGHGGASW